MARPSTRLRRTIPWALRRDRGALRRDRDAAAQAIMRRSRGAIALNRAGRDRGFSATPANYGHPETRLTMEMWELSAVHPSRCMSRAEMADRLCGSQSRDLEHINSLLLR